MHLEDLLAGFAIFVVVLVPVVGFTARFALHPLFETLLRLRETAARQAAVTDERLLQLTEEMQRLAAIVERMDEASSFDRQIRESALPPRTPAAGS